MAKQQRLFLALWPDNEVRDRIVSHLKRLNIEPARAKIISEQNLHITLRYIGTVDEAQSACIRQVVESVVFKPIELQLDRQGYWARPRVAWLGCRHIPQELRELVQEIESVLSVCGIEPESRPYIPHLSFMRKVRQFPAGNIPPIDWPVSDFVLALSETHPDGVRYSILNRWP